LKFGIFDWLDGDPACAADRYDQRLRMVELADSLGFYAYHLAEHHGTSLGLAPSPNLFLAAAAAATHPSLASWPHGLDPAALPSASVD
jgi:alkanesulfonate monooxygenase SsuD/methylene tetrahydromethanopterin reductase-like flavin-dependent oxidoreductase (luciferase family)